MSKPKKKVDINVIIRLDDKLKEQLPTADITVDENAKIVTLLSVAQLASAYSFYALYPDKPVEDALVQQWISRLGIVIQQKETPTYWKMNQREESS